MISSLEKLEIVKERGEATQILGGLLSPPHAAKLVRTIFRIEHPLRSLSFRWLLATRAKLELGVSLRPVHQSLGVGGSFSEGGGDSNFYYGVFKQQRTKYLSSFRSYKIREFCIF